MDKQVMLTISKQLDEITQVIPGSDIDFWFARDLMEPLGYQRWENFVQVINKAIASCATTGEDPDDHFRGVTKMVSTGSGADSCVTLLLV